MRRNLRLALRSALVVPTMLAATSPTLQMLVFCRFVQGLIMPGAFAIAIAYIGEEWPPESVARVMSVYVSGTSLGGFLGRIVSGLAAERLSWHWAFVIVGLITLAGSYVVARWLPYERHPRHVDAEPDFAAVLRHLRNPRLLATFAVGFIVLFSLVGIFTYITFYLAAPPFRLSRETLSYLFVVYLIGLVVTPAAGHLIGHVGLRAGVAAAIVVSMLGAADTLAFACCGDRRSGAPMHTRVYLAGFGDQLPPRGCSGRWTRLGGGPLYVFLLHWRYSCRGSAELSVGDWEVACLRSVNRCAANSYVRDCSGWLAGARLRRTGPECDVHVYGLAKTGGQASNG